MSKVHPVKIIHEVQHPPGAWKGKTTIIAENVDPKEAAKEIQAVIEMIVIYEK